MYLSELEDEMLSIDEKRHIYTNLSKVEREALKDLMEDSSIVSNQLVKVVLLLCSKKNTFNVILKTS